MRLFFCFLFTVLALGSCSKIPEPPVLPDKDLETIILRGWYAPADSEEKLKALEKALREEGRLRKGQSIEEKYPHRLKEIFRRSGIRYCYNKTEKREPMFKEKFRARLYDKAENLLTEDFLRLEHPDNYDEKGRYSKAYLE
ncbi:MAG: hypothetical protein OXJ52_06720, partial [Oligoflexia bacterium]|nr:hypothetical protein [Oligoflexia bacterium]